MAEAKTKSSSNKKDRRQQESRSRKQRSNNHHHGRSVHRLTAIAKPQENDVLYGRGGLANHHSGNKRYRELIQDEKRKYLQCGERSAKTTYAMNLVHEWRKNHNGRFLLKDDITGLWNDVGDKKARVKTSQLLRENAPKLRKEIETDDFFVDNNKTDDSIDKKENSARVAGQQQNNSSSQKSRKQRFRKNVAAAPAAARREARSSHKPKGKRKHKDPPEPPRPLLEGREEERLSTVPLPMRAYASSSSQPEATGDLLHPSAPQDDTFPIFRNVSDLYNFVADPDGEPLLTFDLASEPTAAVHQYQTIQHNPIVSELTASKGVPPEPVSSSLPPPSIYQAGIPILSAGAIDQILNPSTTSTLDPTEEQINAFNTTTRETETALDDPSCYIDLYNGNEKEPVWQHEPEGGL